MPCMCGGCEDCLRAQGLWYEETDPDEDDEHHVPDEEELHENGYTVFCDYCGYPAMYCQCP